MRWPRWLRRNHRVIVSGPYDRHGHELWRCDCTVCSFAADADLLEHAVDAALGHVDRNVLTIASPDL